MNGYAVIPMSEYLKEKRRSKALEKELVSVKKQLDTKETVIAALKEELAWHIDKLRELK